MYRYINPRTHKWGSSENYSSQIVEALLEDKEHDIVLCTSKVSNTFKVFKWHPEGYAGDWEGADNIAELPIELLKSRVLI